MAAYCASKYGMEAFTDCLRQELAPWKISVSVIEPGFHRTPMVLTAFSCWDRLLPNAKTLYSELYERSKKNFDKIIKSADNPSKGFS